MKQSIDLKDYDLLTDKQKNELKPLIAKSMPDLGFTIPLTDEIICGRCNIGFMIETFFDIVDIEYADERDCGGGPIILPRNDIVDINIFTTYENALEIFFDYYAIVWNVEITKNHKTIHGNSFVYGHDEGKGKNKVHFEESGSVLDGAFEETITTYKSEELCDALYDALKNLLES